MCLAKALSISACRGTGCFLTVGGIDVDIVAASMTMEYTAFPFELANQLAALHNAIALIW